MREMSRKTNERHINKSKPIMAFYNKENKVMFEITTFLKDINNIMFSIVIIIVTFLIQNGIFISNVYNCA